MNECPRSVVAAQLWPQPRIRKSKNCPSPRFESPRIAASAAGTFLWECRRVLQALSHTNPEEYLRTVQEKTPPNAQRDQPSIRRKPCREEPLATKTEAQSEQTPHCDPDKNGKRKPFFDLPPRNLHSHYQCPWIETRAKSKSVSATATRFRH